MIEMKDSAVVELKQTDDKYNLKRVIRIIVKRKEWAFTFLLLCIPVFLTNEYYLSVLGMIAISAMVTLGLGLMTGYAGQISMGQNGFMGVGAYVVGLVMTSVSGMPPLLCLVGAGLLSALVAFIIGLPIMRLKGFILGIATLGFNVVFYALATQMKFTGGTMGINGIPFFSLFGYEFKTYRSFFVLTVVILCLMLVFSKNLVRSRVGRAFKSIAFGEGAAASLGVDSTKYKLGVFVISAFYAGVAGGLMAFFLNSVSPRGYSYTGSLILVLMVVFGGSSSLYGPLLGTFIIMMWEALFREYAEYNMIGYSLLLLVTLALFPQGIISGKTTRIGEKFKSWLYHDGENNN